MTETELEELAAIARQEARRRLTVSGGDEVDDVVQTSLLDFVEYAANNEVGNPGGLIRVMARRWALKFRDKWEQKRADPVLELLERAENGALVHWIEMIAPRKSPSAALAARREAELVAYAAGTLDPLDREIIRLTYLSDPRLTAPEVGKRVGLAEGTIRNRLVRIRRLLAELLDPPCG